MQASPTTRGGQAPRGQGPSGLRVLCRVLGLAILVMALVSACTARPSEERRARKGSASAVKAPVSPPAATAATSASPPAPTARLGVRRTVEARIHGLLDHRGRLTGLYSCDDSALCVYRNPEVRQSGEAEWAVHWDEVEELADLLTGGTIASPADLLQRKGLRRLRELRKGHDSPPPHSSAPRAVTVDRPLAGVRIALDPGHVAGDLAMGRIEGKYVVINPAPQQRAGRRIELVEGQLTLATCLLLREKLSASGAIVFMTREKQGETAFGKSFPEWIKADLDSTLKAMVREGSLQAGEAARLRKADQKEIFSSLFRDCELRERARRINEFGPDLTVIVHYNVDERNIGWSKFSNKDFCLAFIPGNLAPDLMRRVGNRGEFVRLAISNATDQSRLLASSIVQALHRKLDIPVARAADADYLREKCVATDKAGVFGRDLVLTRLVHSPLAYCETLYQDSAWEGPLLMDRSATTKDGAVSRRVAEAAEAYYEGIRDYRGGGSGGAGTR